MWDVIADVSCKTNAKLIMAEYLTSHDYYGEIVETLSQIYRNFFDHVDSNPDRLFNDPFDILTFMMSSSKWRRLLLAWKKEGDHERIKFLMALLFFQSVSDMIPNVTWNNCIFFKLADLLSRTYIEHDISALEPYKTYDSVEELIIDENYEDALEQYGLVMWSLMVHFSKSIQEKFNDDLPDPNHVCTHIENYDQEAIIRNKRLKRAHNKGAKYDLEKANLKDKSDSYVAKMVAETFRKEYEEVDYCNECEKFVSNHQSFYFLKCLIRMMDCYEGQRSFENAYAYADYAKEWMEHYMVRDVEGAHFLNEPEIYRDLADMQTEYYNLSYPEDHFGAIIRMMVDIKDYQEAIMSIVPVNRDELEIFTGTLHKMQKHFTEGVTDPEPDRKVIPITPFQATMSCRIQTMRAVAKIVVNPKAPKKVENGVFYVQDFQTAVRIAKDGDKVFLEPGYHMVDKDANSKVVFQVNKAIDIFGSGPHQTALIGAFSVNVVTKVGFYFMTLRLGDDQSSKEAYYVLGGSVTFENCCITSPVNTMLYVMKNQKSDEINHAIIQGCLINGLDICQRFATIDEKCCLYMMGCYVKNMYSVITVHDAVVPYEFITVNITACLFEKVQDGIKMIVHHETKLDVLIDHLVIKLDIIDPEQTSHGVSFTGGSATIRSVLVQATHTDLVGFSLHSLTQAQIRNVLVSGNAESLDLTSIGKGLELSEIKSLVVRNLKVENLRIGLEISNQLHDVFSEVKAFDICAQSCSIGMLISQEKSMDKTTNMVVLLAKLEVKICYYGLMLSAPNVRLIMTDCDFEDVPKAMLLHKDRKRVATGTKSAFFFPFLLIDCEDVEKMDAVEIEEKVRRPYYVKYSEDKLPFRVAYEHCDFDVITC